MAGAAREIGLPGLAGYLSELGTNGQQVSFGQVLKDVSAYLAAQAKQSFEKQRAPDGTAWAPFKKLRSRKKDLRGRRRAPHKTEKLLYDRGFLMASVSAAGAKGSIREMTATSLVQGSNIEYGPAHQEGAHYKERTRKGGRPVKTAFGTVWEGEPPFVFPDADGNPVFTRKIRAHDMPARPFLGITQAMADRISQLAADDVARQIAGK